MTLSAPEPPKNRDRSKLHPAFRARLEELEANLAKVGVPTSLDEGWRSATRQHWLWCSGRTRPGSKLTDKDGVRVLGEHQKGLAADLYPVGPDGRVWIPPAAHDVWTLLAAAARGLGLRAGRDWWDCPHVEWQGPLPESGAQREGL